MRIFLASYQSLSLHRGGPTYKLEHTRKALQDLGYEIINFDMWERNYKFQKDDIVHIFNASVSTYALAVNLKSAGVKYVVNPIFFSNHPAKKLRFYRKLDALWQKVFIRSYSDYSLTKAVCDAAEFILPNTIAEGDLLIEGLDVDKSKTTVIHNGVEQRFAKATPELFVEKYGIKDFVLYVGHLGPYRKNGLNIIKALSQVDAPVVLVADVFSDAAGAECRTEIAKAANITHIEWIDHDDPLLESAYAACKVFALPTRYETPGRAALEAGLAQANIVITPHGGTREYFGEYAEYIDPDSIESIRTAVESALKKPKTSMLKNHIMQNYIWPVIAKETVKIYQKVIDSE